MEDTSVLKTTVRLPWKSALLAGVACGWWTCAKAQEPPVAEQLPQPRPANVATPSMEEPALNPVYFRTSRYDIWQFYAVNRSGYFRPRVVLSPYGAYYLYNGQPFPWVSTHSLEFAPTIANEAWMMPYAEP